MKKKKLKAITRKQKPSILILSLLLTSYFLFPVCIYAEVVERIVAVVNDDVILLSEFKETLKSAKKSDRKISEEKVLNEMINRMLLLKEARKIKLNTYKSGNKASMDETIIINEYIDRRIKVFIHIPYQDIESYYAKNRELFAGKEFYDVRDEIEKHLVEEELNVKLHEYIEELRKNSYIRIQLDKFVIGY